MRNFKKNFKSNAIVLCFFLASGLISFSFIEDANADMARVDCYSESSDSPLDDYYDCGPCTKVDGRIGTGNSRTCKP